MSTQIKDMRTPILAANGGVTFVRVRVLAVLGS